ncbi:hypothetical protein RU86_GL000980 [Lactococcus piscium]|uniref:Uncharacterized protein n=1 Tax=Pseudolactococcus piscium TaxID=1364 RepID=A0A2A5S539_9LACT|nr:hypothetical protein [Lactococcus piscium]PCS08596.1 hypothetical protein RU86_GL000980 [Lactococcus piscium]
MHDEMTTEILAKAIDRIKKKVQTDDKTLSLDIKNEDVMFRIINKSASKKDNQLNAMAIAPIVAGQPDYTHVAVVYAGTNMPTDKGKDGFATAGQAVLGQLSDEYQQATAFLSQTQTRVSEKNGMITDVAGFSQAGGYMMKMAAEYGQKMGFKTTSFDDWGKNQVATLTRSQQQWLEENPWMLLRYQNDSWANLFGRDHELGEIYPIIGIKAHNTLSGYFDGDSLTLTNLAKAGIFAPNMTQAQVAQAAKKWVKKYGQHDGTMDINLQVMARINCYLREYGGYATKEYSEKLGRLSTLRRRFLSSGRTLTTNEAIYLDSQAALLVVEHSLTQYSEGSDEMIQIYQTAIYQARSLWGETVTESRWKAVPLADWEIFDALQMVDCSERTMVYEPCQYYEEKINKIKQVAADYEDLVAEIKVKINDIVQRDWDLARQLF